MDAKKLIAENWPMLAIAGGLYVVGRGVETLTDEQRKARAQTNTGAPTDRPGQVLPGESDYIKIWKGQKVDAITKFGAPEPPIGKPVTPVTGRLYAQQTIVTYWARELSRLCGFTKANTFGHTAPDAPFDPGDLSGKRLPLVLPFTLTYRGIVSLESAQALVVAWNRYAPQMRAAMFMDLPLGSVSTLTGPMSEAGAAAFWDAVRGLAIAVDVDRAVPDASGLAWEAILEAGKELPGRVGELAHAVARETGNVLWDLITGLVPLPYLLATVGAVGWVLYRRAI